jgi:hypothetical protein
VRAQEQESSAAKVTRDWMYDGKRESGGYGCVDGVASFAQDLNACIGGKVMHADDHAVLRANRLFAAIGERVGRAFLRDGWGWRDQSKERSSDKGNKSGEAIP